MVPSKITRIFGSMSEHRLSLTFTMFVVFMSGFFLLFFCNAQCIEPACVHLELILIASLTDAYK